MAANVKQHDPEFPPRLPLYTLPTQKLMETRSIPAGMVTPPLHPPVSVPFQWEEEPGRPRPWVARASSVARRCLVLDLPPRLVSNTNSKGSSQSNNLRAPSFTHRDVGLDDDNSPTSVLIDPYDGRHSEESPTAFGAVAGEPYGAARAKSLDCGRGGRGRGRRVDQWLMGLWRRRNSAAKGKKAAAAAVGEDARFRLVGGGGGDAAPLPLYASAAGDDDGANKAKITRFTRKRSFTASQFVASIYGSFKHMVSPRGRKKTNSRVPPHTPLFLPSNEPN